MKRAINYVAILSFAILTFAAHAADAPSIVIDPMVLETKTSIGQNNAYRAILGKLNNSPICIVEKWSYEDNTRTLGKKLNAWDCRSLSGGDQIGSDPALHFSDLQEAVNGFKFKVTKSLGSDFIQRKTCVVDPYTPPEMKITCSNGG